MSEAGLPFNPAGVPKVLEELRAIGLDLYDPRKLFAGLESGDMARMSRSAIQASAALRKRNLDALAASNRALVEGACALGKCQAELLRKCVTDFTEQARAATASDGATPRMERQLDYTRRSMANAARHLQESIDILSRTRGRLIDVVGRQVADAFDELGHVATAPRKRGAQPS